MCNLLLTLILNTPSCHPTAGLNAIHRDCPCDMICAQKMIADDEARALSQKDQLDGSGGVCTAQTN